MLRFFTFFLSPSRQVTTASFQINDSLIILSQDVTKPEVLTVLNKSEICKIRHPWVTLHVSPWWWRQRFSPKRWKRHLFMNKKTPLHSVAVKEYPRPFSHWGNATAIRSGKNNHFTVAYWSNLQFIMALPPPARPRCDEDSPWIKCSRLFPWSNRSRVASVGERHKCFAWNYTALGNDILYVTDSRKMCNFC
jgi:hypothetical protein